MYHFCTYFDHRYLPRGLALYASLKKHCSSFHLSILSLSEECSRALAALDLPEVTVVSLRNLEAFDAALLRARENRSLIEYYFTLTPSWMLYLFENDAAPAMFTYLDADLFFFSDPAPVFAELRDASIGIIGHRFPPAFKDFERFGIYNVGWLSFRRDANADACLRWWRERCLEWCYDRAENGRFADQKYLDDWPSRFKNVAVVEHKGAGVAPWNIQSTTINRHQGRFLIDGEPLIFYHFHGIQMLTAFLYTTGLVPYGVKASGDLSRLYSIYLNELNEWAHSAKVGDRIRYNHDQSFIRRILLEPSFFKFRGIAFEFDPSPVVKTARYFKRLLARKQAASP